MNSFEACTVSTFRTQLQRKPLSMPRRLLLDQSRSPLDKIGWLIIRLHALSSDGAISHPMKNAAAAGNAGKRQSIKRDYQQDTPDVMHHGLTQLL
ncbi:hypothetical protein [Type-E symbiont of Plautia stali]|uniref:hypothetical protein n=1 Tax=Type-E symbiont of Plautia stali TaxID=1560357 RepID=UPI002570B720|nr:hypothetical protein [Type-E symbiont of Plautia stali]